MFREASTHLLAVGAVALALASPAVAASEAEKCAAAKIKLAGKYGQCRAKAVAKAIKAGAPPDYLRCDTKLMEKWGQAEEDAQGACPTTGDATEVQTVVTDDISALDLALAGVRYIDNGDGTITDTETGLMWERKSPGKVGVLLSWYDAMGDYLSDLNGRTLFGADQFGLGGHSDWRVPTTAELLTIARPSPCAPNCVDPIFLPNGSNAYWTSTTFAFTPTNSHQRLLRLFQHGAGADLVHERQGEQPSRPRRAPCMVTAIQRKEYVTSNSPVMACR
jgi:hypothetical protein